MNLKYLGWPYREYIKTAENGVFWEELHSENDFEAVLVNFCCHDYGANASEAVQKIATDQKVYHKCFSYVIVCWIAKIYQAKLFSRYFLLVTRYLLLVTRYFLLVTRCFLLVTCYFLLVTCWFLLVTCYFLLVTRYILLVTCYFLFVARYFLLVTRYFLLVTWCFLLVTRYFLLVTCCFLLVTRIFFYKKPSKGPSFISFLFQVQILVLKVS